MIIDGYALVLPTVAEIRAFFAENTIPSGWQGEDSRYWAAGPGVPLNTHFTINVPAVNSEIVLGDDRGHFVFFQVLTAQRTEIVNLPANQSPADQPVYTTTVVTFDINDSLTGGSLIAELALIDESDNSLIELNPATSEVAIEHNLVVTVTGLGGESSVSADEGDNVDLRLNFTPPQNVTLNVELSYTNITGTPETAIITVLADRPRSFSIPVGGEDEIAAQSTRTFSVTVLPGLNYVVGDPSAVAINVLNDDAVEVDIVSLTTGPIVEGNSAEFGVQVNNDTVIATSLAVTIELTTVGGDFGISQPIRNVVIAAGETNAMLTVTTGGDIDEVDGSLTARIISLAPGVPVSGVQPTFDVNPATVMIQDDDELLVRITTLDNTISESDDIRLLLTLSSTINRNLPVNLSYIDDSELLVNTGEPSVEEVPAGMTTYTFIVPIINDDIAAQSTRNIVISVATGAGLYTIS